MTNVLKSDVEHTSRTHLKRPLTLSVPWMSAMSAYNRAVLITNSMCLKYKDKVNSIQIMNGYECHGTDIFIR